MMIVDVSQSMTKAKFRRQQLVVVLALTSGATDAIGFLALGSTFTSVMTGNLVLLGVHLADLSLAAAGLAALAIVSFCVGAIIGTKVAGKAQSGDRVWPAAVTRAFLVEFVLFAAFATWWWGVGADPGSWAVSGMLTLNAAALGLQSSAIQRFGVSGLSTTYLTGTLTSVVMKLSHGDGFRAVAGSLAILLGLVVGAGIGLLLIKFAVLAVPAIQLLTLGVVLVFARSVRRLEERTPVVATHS